jgi:hypothetical protein
MLMERRRTPYETLRVFDRTVLTLILCGFWSSTAGASTSDVCQPYSYYVGHAYHCRDHFNPCDPYSADLETQWWRRALPAESRCCCGSLQDDDNVGRGLNGGAGRDLDRGLIPLRFYFGGQGYGH